MWACLFSDVKKSRKDDDGAKRLIELLSGPRSVQALRSTRSRLALKFFARCHRGAQLRHLPRCHRGAQLRHLPRRHRGAQMFSQHCDLAKCTDQLREDHAQAARKIVEFMERKRQQDANDEVEVEKADKEEILKLRVEYVRNRELSFRRR